MSESGQVGAVGTQPAHRLSIWLQHHIAKHRSVLEYYEWLLKKHPEAPPERILCHQGLDGFWYLSMPRDDQVRRLSPTELQQNERHDELTRLRMPFHAALHGATGILHTPLNKWCGRVRALSSAPNRLREQTAFALARVPYTLFPELGNYREGFIIRAIRERIEILDFVLSQLPHAAIGGGAQPELAKPSRTPVRFSKRGEIVTDDFAEKFNLAMKINRHDRDRAADSMQHSPKTISKLRTAGSRVDMKIHSHGQDYINQTRSRDFDKFSSPSRDGHQ
jgi:hypothetical protein